MLALFSPADKAIRAQVAESVSLVAELDFPLKWTDLIDVRTESIYIVPSPSLLSSNLYRLFRGRNIIST
jgi:hypothetical protein